MKTVTRLICLCLFALAALGCSGGAAPKETEPPAPPAPEYSDDSVILDSAITRAASYFSARFPAGAKVALVPFEAPRIRLSEYVFEELWSRFEDTGNFVMVDRRNLDLIEAEIKHQLESGRVDDELAVSVTRQYGAEILVYGQIVAVGNEYRMTIYATDVEKAASSQRAFMIKPDNRLEPLLTASLDDEVERAVLGMARSLNEMTTIAIGRICYTGTDTVSTLSAWLKNSIIAGAQKQQEKIRIASESESADFAVKTRGLTVKALPEGSAIQAIVIGNYSPLDSGAEVSLQLISTFGNKPVLSSSKFNIDANELDRRKLSLLPVKDNTSITKTEFESKQNAVDSYAGRNNRWTFTVTPDDLDGIYYDNDTMSMRIYSERDCYFRVIHVDVNGSTQVIYPHSSSPNDNNFIRAGETRRIPDNSSFRMMAPFGEELILVAAYDRPFLPNLSSAPGLLNRDSIVRGLEVEGTNHASMSPSATAKFSYTILAR